MVWFTMSLAPPAGNKKRKKSDSKPHSQINKCLNEKRRREQENIHIEELAELVSASPSDMSSLSCKPDKCAILKETVNQIRNQPENELCDDLQQSEVSSSKPNIINNQVFGSILLEALEGFLFVVNIDGKIEFVSENILSFLNFHQEELNDKNIYDFIHPDDRARFNSNLLLMMPLGNGRDWSSENTFNSGKTTKHFNCRFLVKQEDLEVKMESKSSQEPQYENLNITANYMSLGGDSGSDESRNGLTCIARRIAYEDKRVGLNKVEQFTTRIDQDWKVVDLDTSMLSQSSNQYLRQELLGSSIVDFCHPNDLPTLKQHLKETFENEGSTCVPYKFRIGQDRYARIKTKSRCFRKAQTNEEYVISTHSVIRDSDTSSSNMESPKPIQSPSSVASTSSGPGSVSDSSTSINGGMALSPAPLGNSFGNFSNALGAGNSTDYVLGDLVLDMFPGGNWNLDPASTQSKESDCTSMTSFASSPSPAPMSNRSDTTIAASPSNNSAFVNALASGRSTSSAPSPVMQNRAPTPYGGTCYSPSTSQSNSGRHTPPRALSAKSADSLNCSSTDNLTGHNNSNINSINNSNMNNIIQNMRLDRQFDGMRANQKLRNLLTQNSDSAAGRQAMRQNSQDEVMVLGDSRVYDNSSQLNRVGNQSVPRTSDVILRDLLNQEEDAEAPVEPIRIPEGSVPNPLMQAGTCKPLENSAQQRLGNNNMLRKLLNNDDSDRNYRKPQDLIHQLLTSHSGNKASSLQNDRLRTDSLQSPRIADVPKPMSAVPGRSASDVTYLSETSGMKRKVNDKSAPIANKKSANHTQLAGQNPMLASMLAQTPRTPPLNLPTDAASTLRNQLPQERLPKNLEKKLVHTPVTAPTSMNITVSSASYTQATQRDIVTNDTRGHLMQSATSQVSLHSGLRTVYSHQQQQQQQQQQQHQLQQLQQQQMLLDKLVVSGTEEDLMLAKSMGHDIFGLSSSAASSSPSMQNRTYSQLLTAYNNQLAAPAVDNTASLSLANILNDTNLLSDNSMVDPMQAGSSGSDLNEHTILEQIYSLQEEHKVTAPQKASNPATILKNFLSDSMEFQESSIAQQPTSVNNTLDINDKIAISRIQKDLMATSPLGIGSKADNSQNVAAIPTYSQAGSRTNLVQAQLTQEQILLLQQQQQLAGSLPPNYNLVTNRVRLPVTTQNNNVNLLNQEILAQRRNVQIVRNIAVGNVNVNSNQFRKALKQKQLYLQQEQKRLLQQQQKQQLTMQTQQPLEVNSSAGTTAFPENMTELLNNTVAPNVTLLRSSGIPEVPGSARFNLPSAPLPSPTGQPSPSQLSPGQRASPFSPLPPFPSHTPPPSYPQQGPSPSPSLGQPGREGGSPQWNQRMATSPIQQNLQLQNPMLNAQLSQQASIGANQARLTAQQRQQLALRSMPSPTSVQNSRGVNQSVYSPQSEGNFSPLSPGMVLQSQAQQQRIQRVRIASGSHQQQQQQQQNFSSEPLLSPQPLQSPSYSQSSSTTPTSTYVAISSPSGMPVTYSLAPANQHFTFDRQNFQSYAATSNESLRSPAADQSNNDALRQELRALINSQNQLVLSSQNNQQLVQSLSSGSNARVLNIQSLTREALEELGLSVELLPDAQSGSQMFSQGMLNDVNSLENAAQPASPRVQVEEPKPADQKKSLLQQLLSEPT